MMLMADHMVMTAALALPVKWTVFKEAVCFAMLRFCNPSEPTQALVAFKKCKQVTRAIMFPMSQHTKDIAYRKTYCQGFNPEKDFYDTASSTEKDLFIEINNMIDERVALLQR